MWPRTALVTAAALLLCTTLSACGFSPLYGSPGPAGAGKGSLIGPVAIDEVPNKAGHLVRAELGKLLELERAGGPTRRLQISLAESVAGLGYRVDESASRSDLVLTGSYTLLDENGNKVVSGAATTFSSYDVPTSAYGELTAQDDARERAAENLARLIMARLNLQLSQLQARQGASPATPVSASPN